MIFQEKNYQKGEKVETKKLTLENGTLGSTHKTVDTQHIFGASNTPVEKRKLSVTQISK